jgi:transcriptional antiterminator NusG
LVDNIKIKKNWYVVHTYSGQELKVKEQIKKSIIVEGFNQYFGRIIIPSEEVIEIKFGKKRKSSRKFFPGYVLVEMNMKKNLWYLIKRIPGVLDFIGGSPEKPMPINEKEINNILFRLKNAVDKPKPKILFEPGEIIRVVDGPFSDFNGSLEEVNYDKNRLKVSVMIFGRSTPVDLDFSQVEKV